jgi:transposase
LENATLEEVRVALDCTPTKKGFRRLQALRWLYEGKSREEVAALSDFHPRHILRFIKLFNLAGLDGLIPGRSSGRRRILPKAQVAEQIVPLIEDPSLAGQTHWTAVKLHGWIKEHLQTQLGYSTTVRYLHEAGYKLKVPRPWPLNQDEEQREAFCEKLRAWQDDPNTDLWFCDESGFEGDPRPRRTWTKIGKVRTSPHLGEHIRHNVFGAVRPSDGRLCSMLFNLCDSETFQVFLNTLAEENPPVPVAALPRPQRHREAVAAPEGRLVQRLDRQELRPTLRPPHRGPPLPVPPTSNPPVPVQTKDLFMTFILKTGLWSWVCLQLLSATTSRSLPCFSATVVSSRSLRSVRFI